MLCEQVVLLLGVEDDVTRQALSSYEEIQVAYTNKKAKLRENDVTAPPPTSDSTVEYLEAQIADLTTENERLNRVNNAYKQRFILWQNNAYKHGIRLDSLDAAINMLEQPLIEIKRSTGGQ